MTYRSAPDPQQTGWPKGIPYIIGNEACERFSFYGMKAILKVYLITLLGQRGMALAHAQSQSTATVHFFIMALYALPLWGAVVADRLLGKYLTILYLSLVYCAGHAVIALMEGDLEGTYFGLALLAIGAGGIKPCVSAHVGDQFGRGNWHRLERVFQAFYFSINFGAFFSTLLVPWLRQEYGWALAFGVPGILMAVATLSFWLGRHAFVHVPPSPGGRLGLLDSASATAFLAALAVPCLLNELSWSLRLLWGFCAGALGIAIFAYRQRCQADEGFLAILGYALWAKLRGRELPPLRTASPAPAASPPFKGNTLRALAARRFGTEVAEGPFAVLRILSVFIWVSMFWALFDQYATSWLDQATLMDTRCHLPGIGHFTLLKEQIQAASPVLVMLLIPFVSLVFYPAMAKLGWKITPLRRMALGMFIAAASFSAVALIQERIDAGIEMHIFWQLVPYLLLTLGEVMVSVTGLEFAYSQAPPSMKSTIMGFWLLTVALGNAFTGALAAFGELSLRSFFWTCSLLTALAAVVFSLRSYFYRYRDYVQEAPLSPR